MIIIIVSGIAIGVFLAYGMILLCIVRYEYEMECIYRYAKMVLRTISKDSPEILAKKSEIKKEYEQAIEIVSSKQRKLLKLVPYFRRAYL